MQDCIKRACSAMVELCPQPLVIMVKFQGGRSTVDVRSRIESARDIIVAFGVPMSGLGRHVATFGDTRVAPYFRLLSPRQAKIVYTRSLARNN
mgnify:CR=1 FL=1